MGFSRQEYWNGMPCPLPGGSSQPRDQTPVSYVSCIGRQVLYLYHHLGSPHTQSGPTVEAGQRNTSEIIPAIKDPNPGHVEFRHLALAFAFTNRYPFVGYLLGICCYAQYFTNIIRLIFTTQ